jgi:hypothetical protein
LEADSMNKPILRFLAIAAVLTTGVGAQTAGLQDFAGTWVMRLGSRNLFVLTLAPESDSVQGAFERPAKFSHLNSIFMNMRGGVRHDKVVKSHFADGVLHLTIRNADDSTDEDSYAMTVNGNRAELAYDDLPPGIIVEARTFERAETGAQVATDWEPNRAYVAGDSDVDSAEMKAIFDEDQRVRKGGPLPPQAVVRTDAERREQTRKLLTAGALNTGKDYEEAAFVFQHGDSPNDFLLAHTLAMVAVSKGHATAIWIASATLDRYLQRIGQRQIFGTQFNVDAKRNWTQEPYDRGLVTDAFREKLGVPSQAVQAKQLEAYRKQP